MSASPLIVRKAAVLGAGVMGAQIAAHLVNAESSLLFELPAKEGDPNGKSPRRSTTSKKLEPAPLATRSARRLDRGRQLRSAPRLLAECDLVIEAISERMDWKPDLYRKVAPHLGEHAIFASNTRACRSTRWRRRFRQQLRPRFCGVHFFNPPRYMHLVELIACRETDAGDARRSRKIPGHHAGQGRDPRQGHAQLHRQPRRRVFDAGDDPPRARLRPRLRCGRCADRPADRPRQERDVPHRRRGRPRHLRACRQHHGRHAAGRSVAPLLTTRRRGCRR